jgi:hypothetical protein
MNGHCGFAEVGHIASHSTVFERRMAAQIGVERAAEQPHLFVRKHVPEYERKRRGGYVALKIRR